MGKRTGFAFYQDRLRHRKILVGVYEANYRLNTYFGPFDQLPDNFIEGETLRKAIPQISPGLKGRIDVSAVRRTAPSVSWSSPTRHINPSAISMASTKCARARVHAASYYLCFVAEPADDDLGDPPARSDRRPR
jgi:hypothetical protein